MEANGELTGVMRDRAISEFLQWVEQHPDPWERAQLGLVMGVPHNPTFGNWP